MADTAARTIDVRALASTREVVAYRDGGLFPVLTIAPDGSIIAVLRGGAGHLGLAGRLDIVRSLDGGQSWTYPNIVVDSDADDRNPGFGTSAKGTLIMSYARATSYDADGNYFPCQRSEAGRYWSARVTRSLDSGLSWDEPHAPGVPALSSCSPFGKMVALPNGDVLMPLYGIPAADVVGARMSQLKAEDSCAYLLRSHDDGVTWEQPSVIAINAGEPAVILLPDGDLFAAVRREQMGKTIWGTRSADGGFTWSEPVQITGDMRHPADLLQLRDGNLLMTYGNRNSPPTRVEGMISRDGGRSWLDVVLVFSGNLRGYNADFPRRVDLGYPSSVLVPGVGARRGVTMYYYNPSIEGAGTLRQTNSGYLTKNYVAIAVMWDEEELIAAAGL